MEAKCLLALMLAFVIANSVSETNAVNVQVDYNCTVDKDALSEFIKMELAALKKAESVTRLLAVSFKDSKLKLEVTDGNVFIKFPVSEVEVTDSPAISDDNVIAYYPSFSDVDNSSLAAGLLNLHEIYPCLKEAFDNTGKVISPRCRVTAFLESGFSMGKEVLAVGDVGDDINVFGNVPTFAFAIDGCPAFTTGNDGCLRTNYAFAIACHLPGKYCAGKDIYIPPEADQ